MSVSVASSIALSALRAAQVGINVTSSNIANADVDGYTVKTANQVSTVSGSKGSGTAISSITGGVDKYVFASLISANADLGAASITTSYTDQLQSLMGSTTGSDDGGTSITTQMSSLETAVTQLASSPDDNSTQSSLISAADTLASQLRDISTSISTLESNANQQISDDVDTVNANLQKIADYNDQITVAKQKGESTADLEDKRNSAVEAISSLLDISTTTTSSGALYVRTTGGTSLVSNTVHELSVDANGSILVNGNKDITNSITNGEIGGLLTLRDETLPAAQSELDTLASKLISTVNSAVADGSSVPAPDSLTGTTDVSGVSSLSTSGTVRIALVDSDGKLTSYEDLDLSGYSTVNDLVSALDATDGISASIDSSGKLTISSDTDGSGVAIGAQDSSINGQSFSSFFGLNSIFTGSSASDIQVSSGLLKDSGTLAVGMLSTDVTTTGKTVLTGGSTTVADALNSALTTSYSYSAVGDIGSMSGTLTDYASRVVSAFASRASTAEDAETTAETLQSSLSDTITSQSGVNVDEETSKLEDYQTLYSAAAQVIQIAKQMFESLLSAVS
ncbi:flagellar hook-associated protein FlgK [Pleomorphomonas oryzae]|uniref:flagellar hook-associated protein FlgK n=1 Tax=Pleomorphomonas oryzae TaxID=261934 RepID=UPI00041BC2B7|nr:flagellar hook-associated protein FlgK [Pleomorphomonas oryzae]